jgi:hypothetical protein
MPSWKAPSKPDCIWRMGARAYGAEGDDWSDVALAAMDTEFCAAVRAAHPERETR